MAEDRTEFHISDAVEQEAGQTPALDTTGTEGQGQPEAPKPKINLDDFEEFRKYRSEQDKRLSQVERQYVAQLREAQQRQAWYEQQLEEKTTSGMDDYQKQQYANSKLQARLKQLESQIQQQEIERAKYATLQQIATETGAPIDLLFEAEDPNAAWAIGARYVKQQAGGVNPETDRRERNQVDLGGGRATAPEDAWETEAKRLLRTKDSIGYARHILKQKYKE